MKINHIICKRFVIYVKEELSADNKKHYKVRDHCYNAGIYREAAHDIFSRRYKTLKETPVVFYNGSTYDFHFIIKRLAKKNSSTI